MIRTVYSALTSDELIGMSLMRDNRSELEQELAQRLEHALGFIHTVAVVDEDGNDISYDYERDLLYGADS